MRYLSFGIPTMSETEAKGLLLECPTHDKWHNVIANGNQKEFLYLLNRVLESIPVPLFDLCQTSIATVRLKNDCYVVEVVEGYHTQEHLLKTLKDIISDEEYQNRWMDVPETLYGLSGERDAAEHETEEVFKLPKLRCYLIPRLSDLYSFRYLKGTLYEESGHYLLATDQLLDDFFESVNISCGSLNIIVEDVQKIYIS